MATRKVGWFEIYVNDMARAQAFYEAVLQVKLEKMEAPDGELQMLSFPGAMEDGPGSSGALVKMEGFGAGVGGTLVYFVCDDCAVEAGRVAAAGGKVERPKMSIGPYGFIALVVDTEGNMIGLHSMK